MIRSLTFFFILLFIQQSHGQVPYKMALDKLLNYAYPEADAPGIAVLISKDGKILYSFQKGLGNIEQQQQIALSSRFRMASVSKQVTARAVYLLAENGKVDINLPLTTWFEGLPSSWHLITPLHLLTHSSGIWDYESLIPADQINQLSDWDVLRIATQKNELYFKPGTAFRYSNTGYCLLALLVEKVSQHAFPSFVQMHLFDPAGIPQGLVYYPDSKIKSRVYGYHLTNNKFVFADQSITSATQGDGGVYFSAKDYHNWASKQLLPDFRNRDFLDFFRTKAIPVKNNVIYNLGLFGFYDKDNHLHLFHSGESTGFNNIIYMDVSQGLVASVFTNRDDFLIADVFTQIASTIALTPTISENLFLWLNKIYSGE